MSIRVTQIGVGGLDDNFSYIVHDDATCQGFVVDPSGSFEKVVHAISVLKITIIGILVTHTHHDHIDALDHALSTYSVPVYVHEAGLAKVAAVETKKLSDKHKLLLGGEVIDVIETPGHAEDAVCFYIKPTMYTPPQLITGDTLFVDGCGRTNQEDVDKLFKSLQTLKALPGDTVVFPGHDYGPTATAVLSEQLVNNKYLNTVDLEVFCDRRLPKTTVQ